MERYSYEQDESYIKRLVEYIRELEEELKKYKHYYDYEKEELADSCYDFSRENDELKEENRKLNENIKWYEKEEDRLRERIRFLEQCLDNKEKVNKQLREDIGKLVMES